MLDPFIRPLIDPPLNFVGRKLAMNGVTANAVSIVGFVIGLTAMLMVILKLYSIAALFVVLNRIMDGIDGAVARHTQLSDFGGFIDIVFDFIIYAGIIFSFGIANPDHVFASAFLIFSFVGPITTFLGYATIAAKKQVSTNARGKKSFYYLGGICEGTETAFVLILICLLPDWFNHICFIYGALCWLTTVGRVSRAWNDFPTT